MSARDCKERVNDERPISAPKDAPKPGRAVLAAGTARRTSTARLTMPTVRIVIGMAPKSSSLLGARISAASSEASAASTA